MRHNHLRHDLELMARDAEEKRQKQQTQDCKRGEHLYETGRRTCRLCGEEL